MLLLICYIGGPDAAFDDALSQTDVFAIDQPSTQDHQAYIRELQQQIQDDERVLCTWLQRKEAAEAGIAKVLSQKQLDDIPKFSGRIAKNQHLLSEINIPSRRFGTVVKSSGIKLDASWGSIIDWALIELDKTRFDNQHSPQNIVRIPYVTGLIQDR